MFDVLGFRPIHTAAKPWHMAGMTCVVGSSFSGAWYQVVRHVKYTRERERERGGEGKRREGERERGGEGKRREGGERERGEWEGERERGEWEGRGEEQNGTEKERGKKGMEGKEGRKRENKRTDVEREEEERREKGWRRADSLYVYMSPTLHQSLAIEQLKCGMEQSSVSTWNCHIVMLSMFGAPP